MCRNIRVLANFEPPTTPDEIHAASLQYVRKVSGIRAPGVKDTAAFEKAVADIAKATAKLLETLPPSKSPPRTREGEREKAKAKWTSRVTRMQGALRER